MNKDDIIKYGLMAAAGYLLYRWLSDRGYLAQFGIGPVAAAAAPVAVAAAAPVAVAQANSYPSVFVQPQIAAPAPPNQGQGVSQAVAPILPPPQTPGNAIQNAIMSASTGDPAIANNGMSSGYVWQYYYNSLAASPLSDAQKQQGFPGGLEENMTLDSFLGRVNATSGLSGVRGGGRANSLGSIGSIVPVAQVPQIPSMNFGGSGRPAFGGRGGGWVN